MKNVIKLLSQKQAFIVRRKSIAAVVALLFYDIKPILKNNGNISHNIWVGKKVNTV